MDSSATCARATASITLDAHPGSEADYLAILELLEHLYWNEGRFTRADILGAHRGSTAWVCARDEAGRLVASARAISDGAKYAWVYDVVVAEHLRGRGLGTALMELLLAQPSLQRVRFVWLATRDAQPLYRKLGFIERSELPPKPHPSTEMVRAR